MFPPGHGNDHLDVGDIYWISVFGTNKMLAATGEEICLREYEKGHWNQMLICEMNSDRRISMRNRYTKRYLGRRENHTVGCVSSHSGASEWLTFTRSSLGGYWLEVSHDGKNEPRSIQRPNNYSPNLKVAEHCSQFGLHKIKNKVFRRFQWVIPNRLARSSAPYYDGEDADESINETSIEFLISYGIKNIISLNSIELSPRQKGRLRAAEISYSHIRAFECTAVTQEQFDQIWNAYDKSGATIVYCGYGDGRTGMAISAIQLFQGRALDDNDIRENGVQCPSQIAALKELRDRINKWKSRQCLALPTLTLLQIVLKTIVGQSTPSILNRHHTQHLRKKRSDRMHSDGICKE
ncbi:hypothetical protein B9Z19DRAFT_1089424 [Tuber borchii]|uniref:Swiss Army Knife protein DSP-PTPase phosphatase domain-containing protein n=1 Tax=Tuber borchii TaxID=42251 RepID=A0A2T6ZK79_TUBBO|nr:hypothetical protein B9Z19DRAFT_1089424 [Tuber borchii]